MSKEDSGDSELERIMGDLQSSRGHPVPSREPPGDREAKALDKSALLRPPVASKAHGEPNTEQERRSRFHPASADFKQPSPVSPSRPKSPWGRHDPYDSAEVTQRALWHRTPPQSSCLGLYNLSTRPQTLFQLTVGCISTVMIQSIAHTLHPSIMYDCSLLLEPERLTVKEINLYPEGCTPIPRS
uniref:Uncharacterized protein n=1 Tax=Paramormyrops kingsleyae TaxID=1676925 RepID=A0A3B3RSV5_9TELE